MIERRIELDIAILISQKLRNSNNNKYITYINVSLFKKKKIVYLVKRYTKFEYKNLNSVKIQLKWICNIMSNVEILYHKKA